MSRGAGASLWGMMPVGWRGARFVLARECATRGAIGPMRRGGGAAWQGGPQGCDLRIVVPERPLAPSVLRIGIHGPKSLATMSLGRAGGPWVGLCAVGRCLQPEGWLEPRGCDGRACCGGAASREGRGAPKPRAEPRRGGGSVPFSARTGRGRSTGRLPRVAIRLALWSEHQVTRQAAVGGDAAARDVPSDRMGHGPAVGVGQGARSSR